MHSMSVYVYDTLNLQMIRIIVLTVLLSFKYPPTSSSIILLLQI